MNEEGFYCIQSFFVLFNSRKGYIQKLYEGWGIYKVKESPAVKEDEEAQKPGETSESSN